MLLTRASEYALLALNEIKNSTEPLGANRLAEDLNIPKSFLAKILQNLARASVLDSRKGAFGGFVLAKDASKIPIATVLEAAEGRMPHVFDCAQNPEKCPNGEIGVCVVSPFLNRFQQHLEKFLDNLTLQEVLNG